MSMSVFRPDRLQKDRFNYRIPTILTRLRVRDSNLIRFRVKVVGYSKADQKDQSVSQMIGY